MSDEFIKIATKEINYEIIELKNILDFCTNDEDVCQNATKFQKHTHKIKGLAPMMGKEELGGLSSQLDDILKEMIEGKKIGGIFDILTESLHSMQNSMNEPNCDLSQINNKIKQLLSDPQ
jgi:HPt (histidine-containing phosphotransfer) domain-containing protein